MQFTSITSTLVSLLLVSGSLVSAAPTARSTALTATVQLTNDLNGINSDAPIPLDGVARSIRDLYGDLAFGSAQNDFQATSVQLTGGLGNNPICAISIGGDPIAEVDAQTSFFNIAQALGVRAADLTLATIVCEQ